MLIFRRTLKRYRDLRAAPRSDVPERTDRIAREGHTPNLIGNHLRRKGDGHGLRAGIRIVS